MSKIEHIQTKEHYDLLLKSGMFWEIYPELSGDWENDKDEILKDLSQKIPLTMSKIEEQVINKLRSRAAAGKAKYGTTMERTDLNNAEWLKHLQEELMDAAVYVEKLLTIIEAYEENLNLIVEAAQAIDELKNQKL